MWTGSAWQPLGSGVDGDVRALCVYDGVLVGGGWFVTAGGATAKGIARRNGSSWEPLGGEMGRRRVRDVRFGGRCTTVR